MTYEYQTKLSGSLFVSDCEELLSLAYFLHCMVSRCLKHLESEGNIWAEPAKTADSVGGSSLHQSAKHLFGIFTGEDLGHDWMATGSLWSFGPIFALPPFKTQKLP